MGPGMETKKNTGGPAFPQSDENVRRSYTADPAPSGMVLRDYFAAKALPLAWALEQQAPTGPYSEHMEPSYAGAAARAYFFADAMLKEREK